MKEYPLPDYDPYRRVAWIRERIAIGTAYAAVHIVDARSLAIKATVTLHKVDIDVVNNPQLQWMWHVSDLKYIPIRSQLIALMSLGHVHFLNASDLNVANDFKCDSENGALELDPLLTSFVWDMAGQPSRQSEVIKHGEWEEELDPPYGDR